MSASIANRLGLLENKLDWMMNTMRMRAAVSSGVIDPHTNEPVPARVFEGSMLELYYLQNALPTLTEADGNEPPPVVNDDNGTDVK